MRRALVILGVLVVATLAALFAVPAMTDWDRYRGAIEEEASRLAGREARTGGKINVRLLPVPYIHIERLRVADTTAAIGEPLFKADAVTVRLALSPLLSGTIEARRVELTTPILNLVLDEHGSGNWASLANRRGEARLPGRVTFEDIAISDGALVIREPRGNIKSQFQKIAGTISAAALEGPYRVNLTYAEASDASVAAQSDREVRELRLSTARQDADGSVRFKGTVRVPTRNQSWAIDATAHDLLGRMRIEGNLTARTPFVRSDPVAARNRSAGAPAMVEIKSTFKADTGSAELAELTLTLDADNKPQLAHGAAKFTWGKETTAEILINARWIDVDRILGTDANTASTATLARIVSGLGDALPGADKLRALLLLDQATLNGDVISALKLEVQKSGGDGYDIREFSGNLPGSARLVLSGKLTPGAAETEFEGPVTLRGASFNRFVAWAGRGRQPPEIARDGPFALDGQLAVGPGRIAGQAIRLELPGGRLGGDASWRQTPTGSDAKAGAGPVLSLALDGPSFDFGALLPSEPRPGALLKS
ncbi:MAG: AsmA family protein, partial [Hyphomicrobium sp.]|nr:AsmA family protein [Hyphomicrobium sp.]